jgi:signal transduction histidine kinase
VFAIGLAVYAGSALTLALLPLGPNGGGEHGLKHTVPFIVISSVVMLIVRRVVGDRDRRARMAERERDLAAREAVVEERARIARELHDVIARNVSMMVVRRAPERRVLDDEQASTREVLETVSRSAAEPHRDAPARRDAPYPTRPTRCLRSPVSTTCPRS